MRNSKLDQICAKRLKSPNFAAPKLPPLITKTEAAVIALTVIAIALLIGYLVSTVHLVVQG